MNILQTLQHISNAYIALCILPFRKEKKNLWLIGGHNGQLYTDNTKVFYEYMLREHKDIDIAWMANKNAPMLNEIKGKKIIKGSIAGYLAFYETKVSLFSNTFNLDIAPYTFTLPIVNYFYNRQCKVYLSHGTISFKKMPQFSGLKQKIKTQIFSSYNIAVASTKLEVKVMHEYGIKKENIHLLGSARHDTLYPIPCIQKTILIAPTWRPWLKGKNTLRGTNFYITYTALLADSKLLSYLKEHDITMYFYLHHMFHPYIKEFDICESIYIKILNPSVDIGQIIQSSTMLITDYSSIASDFYYLKKPILFFQFDREEYMQKVGSEINLEYDIFGIITMTIPPLIKKICKKIDNNYKIDTSQKKGESFFTYFKDKKNCERIIQLLKQKIIH